MRTIEAIFSVILFVGKLSDMIMTESKEKKNVFFQLAGPVMTVRTIYRATTNSSSFYDFFSLKGTAVNGIRYTSILISIVSEYRLCAFQGESAQEANQKHLLCRNKEKKFNR